MGNAFLHGQGGGSGAKFSTGTFTTTSYVTELTIQLDTSFIPDYIIMCPVATTTTDLYCRYITAVSYVKSTDTWTIGYEKTSNANNVLYPEDSFESLFGTISYDETAGTVTFSGNSSTDWMFHQKTTFRWVMWKE